MKPFSELDHRILIRELILSNRDEQVVVVFADGHIEVFSSAHEMEAGIEHVALKPFGISMKELIEDSEWTVIDDQFWDWSGRVIGNASDVVKEELRLGVFDDYAYQTQDYYDRQVGELLGPAALSAVLTDEKGST